jgi:hypothetical protein
MVEKSLSRGTGVTYRKDGDPSIPLVARMPDSHLFQQFRET